VMFDVTPTALPQVRAGRLRALAVTMPERLDILPGVPAMAEFLSGYEAFGWIGFGAPRKTPTPIIEALNKTINDAVAEPAFSRVVRAVADGYTLSIGTLTSHVLVGGLYKLDFGLLTDLTPIGELAYEPLLICVKNSLPAKNLQELIAWLMANPGKASVGIPGAGSTGNLAGISFQNVTGTTFQFVPYRGDAPAVQDMMAGQIDMMIEPSSNFTAQVQAGTIRAIAVPAKTRLFSLPDVPTTDEAGLPGYYASIWFGLWAPKNTPKDIVAKLNSAAVAALADENVKARLNKLGQQVAGRELQDPAAFAAFQKSEADKWWPIIKAANLKVE